ncbi:MAG: family 78 glycoside hydrolase catalytic domain [Atopobiaceae bacterium]
MEEPPVTVEQMFVTHEIPASLPNDERLRPCTYLRKTFSVPSGKKVEKATLVCTAHGIYEPHLNGQVVTDALFTPDFTSYGKLLMYQEYDVTDLIAEKNCLGAILADGWYTGRIGATGDSCQFGDQLAFLAELEISYSDGTAETICSDTDFHGATGRYVWSDIFLGEKQDLRLSRSGWDTAAYVEDAGWKPVLAAECSFDELVPQMGPQVKVVDRLTPRAIWQEDDFTIVDFGQVMAGRVVLNLKLHEGQKIQIEHSEVLDREGHFFCNISGRNKDQTDIFIGDGTKAELKPHFSFHGFRYAKISGLTGSLEPSEVSAEVLSSDMERTGTLVTSDSRINQLLANILWSQKGNMLSIPTDCPQRERMGWTGDIQVFAPTATFFMDVRAFLERWLASVRVDQGADGQIIDYSPAPKSIYTTGIFGSYSSAGWGDAIVFVPWTLYERYGDRQVLEDCFSAMKHWHEFSVASAAGTKNGESRYIWDTKFHYGDWMFPSYMIGKDAKGPIDTAMATKDIVATEFLYRQSMVLAQVADVLGETTYAEDCRAYAAKVRTAFQHRFCKGNGHLASPFQGPLVLALAFGLMPEGEEQAAADLLAQMIHENGDRLDTGFLSVPYLLDVLSDHGYAELAETLLFQDRCPSWLYEVEHGATSMWESWAGIEEDGTVGIYSFNHYAFGCVGDFIVRKVGGLAPKAPGFKEFTVAPGTVQRIDGAELSYKSASGPIDIYWKREDDRIRLELSVPEGTKAHVLLPGRPEEVLEEGSYTLWSD